ncbi:MAG: alpha/beta hydrolase [Thermodesulfobacteriota bacterium]
MKAASILTAFTMIGLLTGCDLQRSLLYLPGRHTVGDVIRHAAANDLRLWPVDGAGYRGIISRKGPPFTLGTVVVFHGNAGPAVSRLYYFPALEPRGYRVVLIEYPGYGGRIGQLSEKNLVADARRSVYLAKEQFGGPVYLWGESLGCGVATALVKDDRLRPRGVALLTPWDSLLNLGKEKFPWLPVRLLLRDSYDNMTNLDGYVGPVAVIMAKRDEVIPNELTERLFNAISPPKRMWTFDSAGHNDWPNGPNLGWWGEIMDFLNVAE